MIAPVMRNARQTGPVQESTAAAASRVAAISAATLVSSSTATYLGTSASTAWSGADASRPDVASSFAPARDTRSRAVSALAHSPANSTSTTAAKISHPMARLPGSGQVVAAPGAVRARHLAWRCHAASLRRRVCLFGAPRREQPVLQSEHRRVLLRVAVVVAEQVQDAVRAQQIDFLAYGVPGAPSLDRRHLRAEHHVAEQPGNSILVGTAVLGWRPTGLRRAQFVHREREHVRRALLAHPAHVQFGHGRLIHQQER